VRVAGLISGTSVDGIDVAIVDFETDRMVTVAAGSAPYPAEVRRAILSASNANTHTSHIARLNFVLGELFAEALMETCRRSNVELRSIELIGSHGQTIFHEGDAIEYAGRTVASTMQIGEGAVIAERTRIPTISDFRVADIAAGGKGAPLAPFLDYRLFRSETVGRAALNIGGIANVTVIPAGAAPDQVIAFDTGPGNMIMDALAPPFDRDGQRARAGSVNRALLDELLRDPFYRRPPPKTAGREQYGAEFIARTRIDIATAAELTVQSIARAIETYPDVDEVIVSGGGAHNRYLMERLQAVLKQRVAPSSEYGVDIDAKEAVLFALLAYESWHGRPCNIPSATGARRAAPLGKLSRPAAISP
jgi:anhydro-N-acetylmuramic acid kinase